MNQFLQASNLVLELSVALLVILGYVIIRSAKRKLADNLFFLMIVSSFVWVATNLLTNLAVYWSDAVLLFWTRMTLVGPTLFMLLLVMFAGSFPESKYRLNRITAWLFCIMTVLILVLIPTSYNVESVSVANQFAEFIPGPLYSVFLVFLLASLTVSSIILLKKYRLAGEQERGQIRAVLLGIFLSILFGILINVVFPIIGYPEYATIGSASILFLVAATSYAILHHRLLAIRLVVTEIATYIALIILTAELFLSKSAIELIFRLVFLFFALLGGRLLIRSMQLELERRRELESLARARETALKELEQRNKNLGTLQRISDIVLQEIELRPMVQKILDEIPVQMDTAVGALVTLVQNGKLEAYTFSANEFSRKINALVGPDLSKYAYPLHKSYNKLHDALLERVVHESSNLADFVSPPLPKTMAVMLQKLIGAKYCLALPLYVGKENLGVMLFVFKVSKDQLNSKDLEMAQAIANDTTLAIERSQAFQKLKDANEYLSQLDKMKDEFISVASHELNTPLAAIEGYLSMILDEGMGKIDDKSRMYLGRAYDSSKRLAELILDLLNTSRIEQGRLKMKYSEVNLAELIQSVIHELQIKADGKKIYLKMEAPKVVPLLWCDPDRIREVIVNLTGNAIKFTEKGGVTIKIEQPDHTLRVSVIDTGRGIDKADQNKLFQKFSQVKREVDEHQGTGLGLYISKSFVDLHKGRLWVESEAGKGASFIFELPIIDQPPKEVPGAILESTFGSPRIEVGTKDAPAIIAASSKKSS